MKSKDVIAALRERDPSGETEVCVWDAGHVEDWVPVTCVHFGPGETVISLCSDGCEPDVECEVADG